MGFMDAFNDYIPAEGGQKKSSSLWGMGNVSSDGMQDGLSLEQRFMELQDKYDTLQQGGGFASQMQGWGNLLQGASGVGSLYLGKKQYDLAKDSLAESKRQFSLNYGNQVKMTNARMEGLQKARVAANPNATPVAEHMQKYGVK